MAADLVEEEAQDLVEVEVQDLIVDLEKCTKRHVEIVVKNVKCHLSQNKTNQSTAMIVFKIIKEIKKSLYYDSKFY